MMNVNLESRAFSMVRHTFFHQFFHYHQGGRHHHQGGRHHQSISRRGTEQLGELKRNIVNKFKGVGVC